MQALLTFAMGLSTKGAHGVLWEAQRGAPRNVLLLDIGERIQKYKNWTVFLEQIKALRTSHGKKK